MAELVPSSCLQLQFQGSCDHCTPYRPESYGVGHRTARVKPLADLDRISTDLVVRTPPVRILRNRMPVLLRSGVSVQL